MAQAPQFDLDPPKPSRPAWVRYLADAWLVIVLAIVYGAALAGVQQTLGPVIEQNKLNETFGVVPTIVPGADPEGTEELFVDNEAGEPTRVFSGRNADGDVVGWVLPGGGLGFADRIEILVAVTPDFERITGVYVLDQKETPGLGDYITGVEFRSGFEGKRTDRPLEVVRPDQVAVTQANEVHAVTGATISSESVARIVTKTIESLRRPVLDLAARDADAGEDSDDSQPSKNSAGNP